MYGQTHRVCATDGRTNGVSFEMGSHCRPSRFNVHCAASATVLTFNHRRRVPARNLLTPELPRLGSRGIVGGPARTGAANDRSRRRDNSVRDRQLRLLSGARRE
ncbi:hypothetical protein EVAR_72175_1 [Eumeta japonica]|uniref:Uncharacterized protein n=1 Tax=Eumeta variegata TaxID=151549 RepID=A0A4C1T3R7_EUMVA|nr:hypothetical protein EVAR_72175_1 [Eumeta japonica]